MSQAQFESTYPGQSTSGLPPSPTVENPGRVFPKSDPSKASITPPRRVTPENFVGNPFMMNAALDKLDHAFSEVISILEQEDRSQNLENDGNMLLRRFKNWRDELERVRLGEEDLSLPELPVSPSRERDGGLFAD